MSSTVLPPAQWAQLEFGFAQLGDKRRNKRLVNIARNLAANPGGTLPQAFSDWAELKAAYRFFGQTGVSFTEVMTPHLQRTRTACNQPGEYLIIEDETLLDYSSHRAVEGLGQIGDGRGRGFELHTSLAVRVESWTLDQRPEGTIVGLFGQSCHTPGPAPKGETRGQRLSRPRKSQRWAEALQSTSRDGESQWIYIADRESDCYEPMSICQRQGVDFIIRACQDRRLAQQTAHLGDVLAKATLMGRTTVEIRARTEQPARVATVEVSATRVDLDGTWRPGGKQPALYGLWAVEVREVGAPPTVKDPLRWVLLTSLPSTTWVEVQRIVGRYAARWWIEEYHKALKTGAGVEDSQLECASRLEPLIAILAVVAVRLLSTKMLARSRPDNFEAAQNLGSEIIRILEHKFGRPASGWNNQNVLIAVARVVLSVGKATACRAG